MPKKDILITILVGIFTALVWIGVFIRLGTFEELGFGWAVWSFVVLVPVVYIAGLYLGSWLSRRWKFFESFAKYVMVGFLNTGIDFVLFNFLMFVTGNERPGLGLSLFKAASFTVAVVNSYFWNKYWAFKSSATTDDHGGEFANFFMVNIVGVLVNVGITLGITLTVDPQFGFSQVAWNNIAAVIATAIALIWNFIGFRLIVFKKNVPGSL